MLNAIMLIMFSAVILSAIMLKVIKLCVCMSVIIKNTHHGIQQNGTHTDILHDDTQFKYHSANDFLHNGTQYNGIQHNDTGHNDTH